MIPLHAPATETRVARTPGETERDPVAVLRSELRDPPDLHLTSSCTHALEAAATLLGICPGDEVVVPAFSFPSTANPFVLRGASVRFADCDPATGNVAAETIARCTSASTRAVVCMHYGGVACEMAPILDLSNQQGWIVIEDAAHSLFGLHDGVPLGRLGGLAAFSFHRTKNISSHEGGALVVNDGDLQDRVDTVLDKGTNRRAFNRHEVDSYEWTGVGSAWRMTGPHIELLTDSLANRRQIQRTRHCVWRTYGDRLRDWANHIGARLPQVDDHDRHPAHLFWVRLPNESLRDSMVNHCATQGVQVARHFGSLPHSSFGQTIARPEDTCPNAQRFSETVVRLPVHHALSRSDVDQVVEAVTSFRTP